MRILRKLRARWEVIWAMRETRLTFIIVGTALGTGAYYYPIFKHMFFPPDIIPDENKQYYEEANLYPIKVAKQRQEEARLKQQKHLKGMERESS